jgi:hypothetical protein
MITNSWFKLATVALAGLVLSFILLWGIQQFNQYKYYNGYGSTGTIQMNGYGNMQMNQNQMNSIMNQNGMNMQGSMNIQGNMKMQGSSNMQSGMGMDMMNKGMNMMDDMMNGMH